MADIPHPRKRRPAVLFALCTTDPINQEVRDAHIWAMRNLTPYSNSIYAGATAGLDPLRTLQLVSAALIETIKRQQRTIETLVPDSLIAAAPDLLALLIDVANAADEETKSANHGTVFFNYSDVIELISKAKGMKP